MKKSFKFLCVMLAVLLTTGCVKMEIGMDINKDKSMNLVITEAFNKSLLEQSDEKIFGADQIKEIEKQGFKAEKYSDDTMSGYTFTKAIGNIDEVSSDKEVTGNIGVSLDSTEEASNQLFTVKKGFFKNTYTAKLTASDSEKIEDQISGSTGSDATTGDDVTTDNPIDGNMPADDSAIDGNMPADDSTTGTGDMDYSAMMSGMDMSFTVNLPYKAISNNATAVDNDGKKLKWDLLKFKEDNIKFEFELYNMTNIYITAGAALLLLIILISLIVSKKKHKKTPVNGPKVDVIEPINPQTSTMNVPETIVPNENLVQPVTPVETANTPVVPTEQTINPGPMNAPKTETLVASEPQETPANNPQVSNVQGLSNVPVQTIQGNSTLETPINPEVETLDIAPDKEISIPQNSNQETENQSSLDIFTTLPEQNQDINKPL